MAEDTFWEDYEAGRPLGAAPPVECRIEAGDGFMGAYSPPDWLVDGIVQTGRLYACTSKTGHGKTAVWLYLACMIQAGRRAGHIEVQQGNVLFLAGENPEDLRARMWGMKNAFDLGPGSFPHVMPLSFPMTEEAALEVHKQIASLGVPFSLIIGDTAAAFFPGEDENDNVQSRAYAHTLRSFCRVSGNPAVVALSHPIKAATRETLLPRGGGGFLNELDGNLTLWSEALGEVTSLSWQGKIRGPDFPPLAFGLRQVPTGFKDRKGREVFTVVAEPMSDEAAANHVKQNTANEDVVLKSLRDHPDWSVAEIARQAGWLGREGDPLKSKVARAIQSLASDRLITQPRKGKPWQITDKGRAALDDSPWKEQDNDKAAD